MIIKVVANEFFHDTKAVIIFQTQGFDSDCLGCDAFLTCSQQSCPWTAVCHALVDTESRPDVKLVHKEQYDGRSLLVFITKNFGSMCLGMYPDDICNEKCVWYCVCRIIKAAGVPTPEPKSRIDLVVKDA